MKLGKRQREGSTCDHGIPLTSYCEDCAREERLNKADALQPADKDGYSVLCDYYARPIEPPQIRTLNVNLRVCEYDGHLWCLTLWETIQNAEHRWAVLLTLERVATPGGENTIIKVEMDHLEFNKLFDQLPLYTFTTQLP